MPLRGRVGRHTKQAGHHARNWPDDQLTVINLLNNISAANGGAGGSLSKSVRSGICSDELYRAISAFEDKQFPGEDAGFVEPDGALLKRMEALAAPKPTGPVRFVTPDDWLGPPSGKTRDITNSDIPLSSADTVWIGLTGDSRNFAVAANIPGVVTIAAASTANDIRWLRLTKPPGPGRDVQIQAKDGTGNVVASFNVSIIELPGAPGPISGTLGPNGSIVILAPKAESDYIDNRAEGVGYYIYHPSFQVYCKGMNGPVYVPDDFLKLDVDKAEPIDGKIYGSLAEANEAVNKAPAKAKGVTPFAYFKGAGGAVIAPTIFSPATTPRIIVGYYGAQRAWAQNVASELAGVAVSVGTGVLLRVAAGVMFRVPDDPGPPPRSAPAFVPPKIRPVGDTVNVGGGGEVPNVTNLNPIKPYSGGPTSGIPNHIVRSMEQMDTVFQAGSVKKMISIRLRYVDVDWPRATKAAAQVMPSGGTVEMNIWTQTAQELAALKAAFESAGFGKVQTTGGPGPGTMLGATKL